MTSKNFLLVLFLAFTVPVFAQDADMSLIPFRQGDLWGYAAADRSIIIKPEYEEAHLFFEGYASVKKGGKFGYITKDGKVAIPFKFFSAKSFRYGYYALTPTNKPGDGSLNAQKTVLFAGAAPKADGYEICIDTKGKQLVKCPAIAENSAPDVNKASTVTVVSNYSTIQKSDLFDKIVGDYKMPGAGDSYYIAVRNDKYGVFNKTFDVIVPFEYSKIENATFGVMPYLLVEKDGLKGILFGNGSVYMAVENTKLQNVKAKDGNDYFIFTKDGKTGLKNTKYKVIAEPIYDDITYSEDGGFILTGYDKLKGFSFLNGNILEPAYTELRSLRGGNYVIVKEPSGKWGYVNSNLVKFFVD